MSDTNDTGAARQTAIVEAATGIFLRYGFKKTSMDDIARAVGISRQALYLHFQTKEALFRAMVAHYFATMRARAREVLSREDMDIEERLLGAFDAMYARGVGTEHLDELIMTTAELVGSIVRELEEALDADVARVLRAAGVAARWKDAGVSVTDLADLLSTASNGIKRTAKTPAEYLRRLRTVIRIVCRGESR